MFFQFYSRLAFSLVLIVAVLLSTTTLLISYRFEQYSFQQLIPVSNLVVEGWNKRPLEERKQWLELVSSLTNTQWHSDVHKMSETVVIEYSDWSSNRVDIWIRLNEEQAAYVEISSWADWQSGYGWLMLNALSLKPALERQTLFNELQILSSWPLDRVNRKTEDLSELAIRQLATGQAVRVPREDLNADLIYMPAGASQVIKIGPIGRFTFLDFYQWLAIVILMLIILAIMLAFIIWPVQKRIKVMQKGIDRIIEDQSDIQLPTGYDDDLGSMAKHIEQMAKSLVAQIEQNRELNQAVSHDLKTPLARLKFLVSMAEEKPTLELFQRINSDIDLLTKLTNELLLYHTLDATTSEVESNISVGLVLKDIIGCYDSSTKISLMPLTSKLPTLAITDAHWRRVCQNLIDNAVQHGRGLVEIELKTYNQNLLLMVSDNGTGMSASDFERLKQPFTRNEKSRNLDQKNHGLGLSLVSAIARHYHGTLDVGLSRLGGAKMIVLLPLQTPNNVLLDEKD